jgi:D-alanyl-D-alanine carboxypeptidase
MRFSRRVLALGLALAFPLVAVPITAPAPVAGVGPLPPCRLDDFMTAPSDYASGPITLVDHLFGVGKDYRPPDLINVREAGLTGSGLVREIALEDLGAMARAARANGTPIGSWSAFRSYKQQAKLFNDGVAAYGLEVASQYWAQPGHSEHQLGLAIDFMTAGGGSPLAGDWARSKAGAWMERHAWEFGWVMSYPKGLTETTCFGYEPWHYRYVGREVAAEIRASGLTIREYLWTHFAMVDPETGLPIPTATPSPSPTAFPTRTTSPNVPSPTASPSGATQAPPSPPPTSEAGAIQPAVAVAGVLLVLAAAGLGASLGLWRRSRR